MSRGEEGARSHRKSLRGTSEVHWINQDGKIVPSFKQDAWAKQKPEKLTPRGTLNTARKPTSKKSTKTQQFSLSIDQIHQTPTYKQKINSMLNSTRFSARQNQNPNPDNLPFSGLTPNRIGSQTARIPLTAQNIFPRRLSSALPKNPLDRSTSPPPTNPKKPKNNNLERMKRIKNGITKLYREIHKYKESDLNLVRPKTTNINGKIILEQAFVFFGQNKMLTENLQTVRAFARIAQILPKNLQDFFEVEKLRKSSGIVQFLKTFQ